MSTTSCWDCPRRRRGRRYASATWNSCARTGRARIPERFQQITAAYEALKDDRARVKTVLFGMAAYGDFELALDALVKARPARRETPGLQTLLAAEGKLHE